MVRPMRPAWLSPTPLRLCDDMTRIEVDIPEGTSGEYSIEIGSDALYGRAKPDEYDSYTLLYRNGEQRLLLMLNSESEYEEHQWLWDRMKGDILIAGLGIGMVNEMLVESDDVISVTIIEKEQDVVDLVWEHCAKDDRFTLIVADIETWDMPEGSHWDVGWLDTWIDTNTLNKKEYRLLMKERYGTYCDEMACWEI